MVVTINIGCNSHQEIVQLCIYGGKLYAKKSIDGTPEKGTIAFKDENTVLRQKVTNFAPGEIHRYTVVMWVEGNDLECTNNILGGELKVHYDFKSYHKEGRK